MKHRIYNRRTLMPQIASDLFSPLTAPAYAMALACCTPALSYLTAGAHWLLVGLTAAITGLVPLLAIALLQRLGMVSDNSLSRREQRFVPMSVAITCYVAAGLLMLWWGLPRWVSAFFGGAAVAALVAMAITLRWKISAHAMANGGLVGLALWLAMEYPTAPYIAILTLMIIITGAVGTTRLALGRHTAAQVYAGALLGATATFGSVVAVTNI